MFSRALCQVIASGLIAALLAGCDRYPTHDAPLANPHAMTPQQRLTALNKLADDAHPEMRWRYEVLGNCDLRIQRKTSWWRWEPATVHDLRHSGISLRRKDLSDRNETELLLTDTGGGTTPMLAGSNQFDLRTAQALVLLMKRDCANQDGQLPGGRPAALLLPPSMRST